METTTPHKDGELSITQISKWSNLTSLHRIHKSSLDLVEYDYAECEDEGGEAGGADFGDAAEHDHEHDGGHDGLDKEPQRAENGLLVPGNDIALHEHAVQIAVLPKFAEVHLE